MRRLPLRRHPGHLSAGHFDLSGCPPPGSLGTGQLCQDPAPWGPPHRDGTPFWRGRACGEVGLCLLCAHGSCQHGPHSAGPDAPEGPGIGGGGDALCWPGSQRVLSGEAPLRPFVLSGSSSPALAVPCAPQPQAGPTLALTGAGSYRSSLEAVL